MEIREVKINKQYLKLTVKSWFFDKISKFVKSLGRLTMKNLKKGKSTKYQYHKKRNINTDDTDI